MRSSDGHLIILLNSCLDDGRVSAGGGGGSTGNWTFSANNATLTGAGVMGIGGSPATSLQLLSSVTATEANTFAPRRRHA